MRMRATFVLTVLLVGLAVFLLKWRVPSQKYLLKFDPYRVEKILLKNREGEFRFEKKGGEWWVVEPIRKRAQQKMTGALVARLVTLDPVRKIPRGGFGSLKETGLESPVI